MPAVLPLPGPHRVDMGIADHVRKPSSWSWGRRQFLFRLPPRHRRRAATNHSRFQTVASS